MAAVTLHRNVRTLSMGFRRAGEFSVAARAGLAGLVVIVGLIALGPIVWSKPYELQNLAQALQAPSWSHPFGTDQLGRDVLSRVLHGGQLSLIIAAASVALGAVAGISLGVASGFLGGPVRAVAMRLVDALLALPDIVQAVIFVAVIGRGVLSLIIALGLYSTPIFARVSFSTTQQIARTEYVASARALGMPRRRLIARHILPNAAAPLVTIATLRMGSNILTGAALNFFGLGVQPPHAEWGLMIAEGRDYSADHPVLLLAPGLALLLVVLAFNLVGDGISDWVDPRSRT